MKILVTGGAGFIGSHVVDKYISDGHEVVVIDDLSTGDKKNVNKEAKLYIADICNEKKIEKIFKKEKPDIVNHHAAKIEVVESIKNPKPTFNVNINGTINILLASGKNKVKKFIFSSTGGAIYGEPENIPADESTEPNPLSPYGLSKYLAEIIIKFYAGVYNFEYCILRYPNVYGPRQNPKKKAGVIAIFGHMMKKGETPTIFGDGTKTRDYVYVGDIANANVIALSKGADETINLGSEKEITDKEIFETIAKITNFSDDVIYGEFRNGEVVRISISKKKANEELGWEPEIDFESGVRKTLENL